VGNTLLVDRVQIVGTNVYGTNELGLFFSTSHYTIMNSIIGPLHVTPQAAFEVQADATVSAVIGSEVDFATPSFSESGLATLICLADYNAAGQPVPQNCNEVAY
jgi:hypothetical protein